MERINLMIQNFWETDTSGIEKGSLFKTDERAALDMAERSITCNDRSYRIAILWKDNLITLPNNVDMAAQRLQNLEKRLSRQPEIAEEHTRIIGEHIKKRYITKLPPVEDDKIVKWYFPHFLVIRKDRSTTKVWIVFDASARYNDIALNDVIHQGPKLQNDLFDVLIRFQRYIVALSCGMSSVLMERYEYETKTRRI